MKSKQPGGQTGRRLLEEMSNDEVRENREFDRERERARRAIRTIKLMNARVKVRPYTNGLPQERAALKAL